MQINLSYVSPDSLFDETFESFNCSELHLIVENFVFCVILELILFLVMVLCNYFFILIDLIF